MTANKEDVQALADVLALKIGHGPKKFDGAKTFLLTLDDTQVVQIGLFCLANGRRMEVEAVAYYWFRCMPQVNMGTQSLLTFRQRLDEAIMSKIHTTQGIVGIVDTLRQPEVFNEYADHAVEVVEEVIDGVSEHVAAEMMVATTFEAHDQENADQMIGAWDLYFSQDGLRVAEARLRSQNIREKARILAINRVVTGNPEAQAC